MMGPFVNIFWYILSYSDIMLAHALKIEFKSVLF